MIYCNMIQALRKETIVKPIYETKSTGGIIVPETAQQNKLYHQNVEGEVVSVSAESEFKNDIKPGDKVMWRRHEGFKLIYDRQLYFRVRDRWILGKYEE